MTAIRLATSWVSRALLLLLLPLGGCAGKPMPARPEHPQLPPMNLSVDFSMPATPGFRYAPAGDGENPEVQQGVTVGVVPLGSASTDQLPDVAVTCQIPDRGDITFLPMGMAVLLNIKNDTGHILRLANSAVLFEDEAGKEFPLVGANLSLLMTEQIDRMYDGIRARAEADLDKVTQNAERMLEPTLADYRALFADYLEHAKECSEPMIKDENAAPTCAPVEEIEAGEDAPDRVKMELMAGLEAKLSPYRNSLNGFGAAKTACVEAATVKLAELGGEVKLVTEDTYAKIQILPGKTLKAFIPMVTGKSFAGPPATIHFKLYDLVTATDTAGNPTKRAHFDFMLARKDLENP